MNGNNVVVYLNKILGDDFDNMTVTVVVNPGQTRTFISIEITDDDRIEELEFFDVVLAIVGDGAVIRGSQLVQVILSSDDG